jgi:hypothetical protein
MLRHLLGFILLSVASPAGAQEVNASPPDVSGILRQTDLDAVTAVMQSKIPSVCVSAPAQDTTNGSVGTGVPCTHRNDASRATIIQGKNTVTAADASWAITWDRPFATPPIYLDARVYGSQQPYLCTVLVSTETGGSGKCYQLVATTLPSVVTSLLGTVISPFQVAGAGLSVRVVARQ